MSSFLFESPRPSLIAHTRIIGSLVQMRGLFIVHIAKLTGYCEGRAAPLFSRFINAKTKIDY